MKSIAVKTPQELKKAIEDKYDEIIMPEKLAKKVRAAKVIKKLSPAALATIAGLGTAGVAVSAAVPPASLITAPAFVAAAAATGVSIPVIIIIVLVGLAALTTLIDDYSELTVRTPYGEVVYKRKRKAD